jgi:hypothetical protein
MQHFGITGAFIFKMKSDIYVPAVSVVLKCMATMHMRLGTIL